MKDGAQNNEKEQIKEIILLCLKHWYYFAISFFICGIFGVIYLKTTTPVWQIASSVAIRHDEAIGGSGSVSGSQSIMSAFGFNKGGENIEDETLKIGSQGYVKEVVKRLNLNTLYTQSKYLGLVKNDLFPETTPIILEMNHAIADTLSRTVLFTLNFQKDKTKIKVKAGKDKIGEYEITSYPAVINTSFGEFTFSKTALFDEYLEESNKLKIAYFNYDVMAQLLGKQLEIEFEKKTSDIIHLNMQNSNVFYAKNILSELVNYYNYEWDSDKTLVYEKTLDFIEERLIQTREALSEADNDIKQFKDKNKLTQIEADVSSYITMSGELQAQLLEAETQLSIAEIIVEFVRKEENKYSLIPYLNISDQGISDAITKYNEGLIKRNELYKADAVSGLALSLDNQIEVQRENLLLSLSNITKSQQIAVDNIKKKDKEIRNKLGNVPTVEKIYVDLYRQQEMQQSVYIFLLEMKEELGVKYTNILPKLKVITPPYSHIKPVSPNKLKIAVYILFLGTALGFAAIYGFPYLRVFFRRKKNK